MYKSTGKKRRRKSTVVNFVVVPFPSTAPVALLGVGALFDSFVIVLGGFIRFIQLIHFHVPSGYFSSSVLHDFCKRQHWPCSISQGAFIRWGWSWGWGGDGVGVIRLVSLFACYLIQWSSQPLMVAGMAVKPQCEVHIYTCVRVCSISMVFAFFPVWICICLQVHITVMNYVAHFSCYRLLCATLSVCLSVCLSLSEFDISDPNLLTDWWQLSSAHS